MMTVMITMLSMILCRTPQALMFFLTIISLITAGKVSMLTCLSLCYVLALILFLGGVIIILSYLTALCPWIPIFTNFKLSILMLMMVFLMLPQTDNTARKPNTPQMLASVSAAELSDPLVSGFFGYVLVMFSLLAFILKQFSGPFMKPSI